MYDDVHLVRCNMVDKPKFQFGQMISENSIVMSAVYDQFTYWGFPFI